MGARKRLDYSCEDGIENTSDHCLSSLNKPRDANRHTSGQILLSHLHDGFLYTHIEFSIEDQEGCFYPCSAELVGPVK